MVNANTSTIAGILDHVIKIVYSVIVSKIGLLCFILFNSPNSFLVSLAPHFFWNIICNWQKIVDTTNIHHTCRLKGNQSLCESLWFIHSRTLFDYNDWHCITHSLSFGTAIRHFAMMQILLQTLWEAITEVCHSATVSLFSKQFHDLITREMIVGNNVWWFGIDNLQLILRDPNPSRLWD